MKDNLRNAVCASATLLISISLGQIYGQGRSTITGFVFGPQRSIVPQIPVELRNEVNSVIGRTKTDGSGRYAFTGVPSGRYSLTVLPLGTDLEEQTQEIEIGGGVSARGRPIPENLQADFHLRARRSSTAAVNQVLFVQEVPEDAKKAYERALSDLEGQRVEEGIAGLRKALELFPDYFSALERLGMEHIKQQKYQDAKKAFSDGVRINPRSFACWYGMGYAEHSMQENEAAIGALKRSVEINKNSAAAFFVLGLSQRRLKLYEDAERSLVRAKTLDEGKTPDIHWNLALLYAHNLKRYKDAADELELYLKADPNIPNSEKIKKLIRQFREQAKNVQ